MSLDFPSPDQKLLSRREIVAGLLMLSAAAVAAARTPNVKIDYLGKHKLDDVIPARIGRWNFVSNSGLVVPPEDQMQLALYSQLLTRVYSDGSGPPIMLLIAYSANETGFLQVHRPEFCYAAGGYQLSRSEPHPIRLTPSETIPATSMTAVRNGMAERLLYWTRIGNHVPQSWAQQRLTIAEDNLRGVIPDATLIRVSTVAVDEDYAMNRIDEFVREMIASVPRSLSRVFIA